MNPQKPLLVLALGGILAATTVQAGLTHRYSFNSNANDSIGTANATIVNNAVITSLNSVNGTGVYFNNASNNTTTLLKSSDPTGQYVTLPTNVLTGVKNLTLEFWTDLSDISIQTAGTWSRVFDFGDPFSVPGSGRNFIMFTPHSGLTPNDAHVEFNLNQVGVTAGNGGTLEGYHHVVTVFDCANGFMEAYVDGALTGHAATTYQITNLMAKALWLGRSEWSGDDYLYGYLDEFRIYDRALSAPEIKANDMVGAEVINPTLSAQLGAVAAMTISDPGAMLERYTTNIAVTADFANATGLSLFNTPGFTLTSSSPTVATIDGGGVIRALKPGTTTITASYGGKTATLQLTVNADTTAPVITAVNTGGYDRLLNLVFSKPLDPVSAQKLANYALDAGAITVSSASLSADGLTVRLITSPFDPNAQHTAVVNNITDLDLAPNTIATDSTVTFGQVPGAPLVYRLYFQNQGYKTDTLANGMTNPGYPYTGGTTYLLSNGLTDAGGRGDNYFSVIDGWLAPTTSGTYTFGVATDDESTLWVSTDDTAAHLPSTATLNCTGYAPAKGYISGGTPPTRTGNSNVTMQAGSKYYFRLIHRNGTGGDNLDVTWQQPGGNPIANNDPAIPARFLIPEIPTNVTLAITGQPTNQTLIQNRPLTLAMNLVGVPAYTSVQWYKNGVAIPNATTPTLSFANAALTNAGTYYAVVSNLVYTVQSSNAVVTVNADTVPPTITSVSARLGGSVFVQYGEMVDPASATNVANYTIAGETISAAVLDSSGSMVTLTVAPRLTTNFVLRVSNVKDLAGNKIVANTAANGYRLGSAPGMIAYWPLDTVVGTKTPDIVSGYDLNLVNLSSADLVAGKHGNAFNFNGSKSQILYRQDSAAEALPIVVKSPSFTLSMWVNYPPAGGQDKRLFSEAYSTAPGVTPNNGLFAIGTDNTANSGKLDTLIRNDVQSDGTHYRTTGVLGDNTWHHFALVVSSNSTAYTAKFYIDGVVDSGTVTPHGGFSVSTTAIGGIFRTYPGQAYFTGLIDDVAIWNRALDPDELVDIVANGTPIPQAIPQPLTVRTFAPDLPAVAKGDSTTLRWDVSKDATKVDIEPKVGDVTAMTVAGSGSAVVTPSASTTYTITVTRGAEAITKTAYVGVIGGVDSSWALLDNFDRYDVGNLPAPWTTPGPAYVVDVNGNRMLSVEVSQSLCGLPLGAYSINEGQVTTVFSRFYLPAAAGAGVVDEIMGVSDKGFRQYPDEVGDMGPGIHMQNPNGDLQVGTKNGNAGALELNSMTFQPGTVYDLWIDITNDTIANGDLLTIWVAPDDGSPRTALFTDYRSDRNPNDTTILGPTKSNLVTLVVGANTASPVYFDDFYISKTGYNSSVPIPFGFTPALVPSVTPPTLAAAASGNSVVISWSKDQGTGYILQSATSVTGTWNPVTVTTVDVGTNTTATVPASKNVEFFRLAK